MIPLCIFEQHSIEAAWRNANKAGEILLRGADDAFLLVRVDTCRRSAKAGMSPQTYFDEYRCWPIVHYQIYLSKPAAVVFRDQLQALPL